MTTETDHSRPTETAGIDDSEIFYEELEPSGIIFMTATSAPLEDSTTPQVDISFKVDSVTRVGNKTIVSVEYNGPIKEDEPFRIYDLHDESFAAVSLDKGTIFFLGVSGELVRPGDCRHPLHDGVLKANSRRDVALEVIEPGKESAMYALHKVGAITMG